MESKPSQEDKEHIDSYRKHQNFKVKKFEFITHVNLWVFDRNTQFDVLWITFNAIRSEKITRRSTVKLSQRRNNKKLSIQVIIHKSNSLCNYIEEHAYRPLQGTHPQNNMRYASSRHEF